MALCWRSKMRFQSSNQAHDEIKRFLSHSSGIMSLATSGTRMDKQPEDTMALTRAKKNNRSNKPALEWQPGQKTGHGASKHEVYIQTPSGDLNILQSYTPQDGPLAEQPVLRPTYARVNPNPDGKPYIYGARPLEARPADFWSLIAKAIQDPKCCSYQDRRKIQTALANASSKGAKAA